MLDTEGEGDLSEAMPMAPYGHEQQVGQLGHGSALSFCVQVYEDGGRLSVVTDAGSHGTHVAGIVVRELADPPPTDPPTTTHRHTNPPTHRPTNPPDHQPTNPPPTTQPTNPPATPPAGRQLR